MFVPSFYAPPYTSHSSGNPVRCVKIKKLKGLLCRTLNTAAALKSTTPVTRRISRPLYDRIFSELWSPDGFNVYLMLFNFSDSVGGQFALRSIGKHRPLVENDVNLVFSSLRQSSAKGQLCIQPSTNIGTNSPDTESTTSMS
ncbi:uncharacterized protein LACBIDRAFT_331582 [Laccaria bicolor S238N-H82]|uniref:Predicted protein n=1 Tax=Laccaria bicolor (strain S238N-H82 / ATCC MYA-4686) TaxID=486041 RepID=B0DPW6_LACBS|nr:uncharacterized protein LACBIDRAFT_331582 [Laccaria bicolor S238N-H82]EDR03283.1 predicted protein [Laccaria bicolor S238N-H82]|eukprot:XP_001886079.1 predicted protein [Laccaria bicolor S238N-H82]